MTRTMYDGITAADVPDGWGVAGYIDGNWPDYAALKLRWPNAVHISVAVTAADDAWALDVENYDATPAQAPGWASRQRDRGNPYPWVYMNASTWPEVVYEFAQQKVAAPLYWVAQYDGLAVVPPGAIAKQHTNTPGYDESVVADYVPGIDLPPAPVQTAQLEETDMLILRTKGATPVYGLSGGLFWHIADPSDLQQYIDAGIKQVTVDAAEIAAIQAAAKTAA
jgi:hypothetical protein